MRSSGFTIAEAVIVTGLAGLLIGGVWVGASKARRSIAIQTSADQLYQIMNNVRGIYMSRPGMFIDNTAVPGCGAANFSSRLSCQGAFPADIVQGGAGGLAFHSWDQAFAGGSVPLNPMGNTLVVGPAVAPGINSFSVRFWNLPVDVCITLATGHSTPDQNLMLKAVIFRDDADNPVVEHVTPDWMQAGRLALPVSLAQAAATCQNIMDGGSLPALEWVFMLR